MRSREQNLKALLGRYLRARKMGKRAILDESCRNTSMARKSILRKIAGLTEGDVPGRKEKRPVYGRRVRVALETLWEIFDRPCGQRLKPLVEEEVGRIRSLGELKVDEKAARLAVTAGSLGTANPVVSLAEDAVSGATTFIAVVAPVLLAALVISVVFWILRRRRKKGMRR